MNTFSTWPAVVTKLYGGAGELLLLPALLMGLHVIITMMMMIVIIIIIEMMIMIIRVVGISKVELIAVSRSHVTIRKSFEIPRLCFDP